MENERELSTGMLSKDAGFRLIVHGAGDRVEFELVKTTDGVEARRLHRYRAMRWE
jgi:hypothetical protein